MMCVSSVRGMEHMKSISIEIEKKMEKKYIKEWKKIRNTHNSTIVAGSETETRDVMVAPTYSLHTHSLHTFRHSVTTHKHSHTYLNHMHSLLTQPFNFSYSLHTYIRHTQCALLITHYIYAFTHYTPDPP